MPHAGHPAVGTLSYDGYTFDGASNISCQIDYVQNDAETVKLYDKITITVDGIIANENGCDTDLGDYHAQLSQPRKRLIFQEKGFGNAIDTATHRDVNNGPRPKVTMWEPIGADKAIRFQWVCEVALANCGSSTGWQSNPQGVLSATYDIEIDINHNGATTRTITGHLVIAQNIQGRRFLVNPENFKRFINSPVPDNFRRTQKRTISDDRTRLDFTITDTQIVSPIALPAKTIEADGTHTSRWSRRALTTFDNTLDIEFETRHDVHPAWAYICALGVLDERTKGARARKRGVLLDDIEIQETIWGYPARFSFRWRVLGDLRDMLEDSGLWVPFNTNWNSWSKSMELAPHSPDGDSHMFHDIENDVVVDLCGQQNPYVSDYVQIPSPRRPRLMGYKNETPPPESSYVYYDLNVEAARNTSTIRQAILQEPESARDYYAVEDMRATSHASMGQPEGIDDVLQESGKSQHRTALSGHAVRAGHPVPRPKIRQIGGQEAVETGFKMTTSIVANALGIPVYAAAWRGEYATRNAPGQVEPRENVKENASATRTQQPERAMRPGQVPAVR